MQTSLCATWYETYNHYFKAFEGFEEGLSRNQAITHAYHLIASEDPIITWFCAATLGSYQVGETLKLVSWPILSWMPANQEVYKSFSVINEEIHHVIAAHYKFYTQHGVEGLQALHEDSEAQGLVSESLVRGFKDYNELKETYKHHYLTYHQDHKQITWNDFTVIGLVFNDPMNIQLAENAAMWLTRHEQSMVQHYYSESALGHGLTLGQSLSHSWIENLVADTLEWGGPKIDGVYFSATQLCWSDQEQRIDYFKDIFSKLSKVIHQQPNLEKLFELIEEVDPYDEISASNDLSRFGQGANALLVSFKSIANIPQAVVHRTGAANSVRFAS